MKTRVAALIERMRDQAGSFGSHGVCLVTASMLHDTGDTIEAMYASLSELVAILEQWRDRTGLLLSDREMASLREARSLVERAN